MNKKNIINLINTIKLLPPFEGCCYYFLGCELYLVFAYDFAVNKLYAKIAYNCDNYQYDYDYDWYLPVNEEGDLIGQEWGIDPNCNVEKLYEEIISAYKFVVESGWKKPVKN